MANKRIRREKRTIEKLVQIYCQGHHQKHLCSTCRSFLDYARQRLNQCPFHEGKPTCGQCSIHCYKPDQRQQAKQVMRYAGPRLLWKHPLLAILHLLDGLKGKGGTNVETNQNHL